MCQGPNEQVGLFVPGGSEVGWTLESHGEGHWGRSSRGGRQGAQLPGLARPSGCPEQWEVGGSGEREGKDAGL